MYNNNIREQKQHTLADKQKIASFWKMKHTYHKNIYKKRIKNDPHALVYFFNQKQKW